MKHVQKALSIKLLFVYVYILFMLFLQLIPKANSVTPSTPNYLYSPLSLF